MSIEDEVRKWTLAELIQARSILADQLYGEKFADSKGGVALTPIEEERRTVMHSTFTGEQGGHDAVNFDRHKWGTPNVRRQREQPFRPHDIGMSPEDCIDPEKFYQMGMTCSCTSGFGECVDDSCACILHLRNRPKTQAELDAFIAAIPLAPRWRHLDAQVRGRRRKPVIFARLSDVIGEDAAREALTGGEITKGADRLECSNPRHAGKGDHQLNQDCLMTGAMYKMAEPDLCQGVPGCKLDHDAMTPAQYQMHVEGVVGI